METREELFFRRLVELTEKEVAAEGGQMQPVDETVYRRVARWFATEFETDEGRGLLFAGGVGTGKSLLATRVIPAIVRMFVRKDESLPFVDPKRIYGAASISSYDLPQGGLKAALKTAGQDFAPGSVSFGFHTRQVTLDDMGAEFRSDFEDDKMFSFIDSVYKIRRRMKLVVTTNLDSEQLVKKYGRRTCDRLFSMTNVLLFNGSSYRDTGRFYDLVNRIEQNY
ncbi:MAG: hypothetical protein ACI35Q_08295 [Marinilabiliaceae bacterium]